MKLGWFTNELIYILPIDHYFATWNSRLTNKAVEGRTFTRTIDSKQGENFASFDTERSSLHSIESFHFRGILFARLVLLRYNSIVLIRTFLTRRWISVVSFDKIIHH